ncbi:SPOR domain-containing protein [Xanthomonas campestris pv. campestris]|uniref:SPOR domain-containing protein n=1 Tax=Xanthomonas campestris pv. campestris (strain B100) TaxID=509169 RepID=B0RU24_XANCB|nr:SPOR domain-containing protein [Xanthomonas campestris]MCD0256341.1 SPOR domain-containing protein [Xanthomonas campestris pv. campestris]MDM7672637.1 SPOR domain-containing protein [Xanthomonas campestris pv. campestris]MDM7693478.1 SPOR domain-containing protein [Xanthomonas campestris pv. campestris]MDM7840652.1 SPOR domain-containing protein [Xanthomonas campestris pv. campestris]MDM7876694.1 SPOR domain-containing protein [Xanthomonas campestris pv. campestris]
MDTVLKQRLIGAIVLVALAVIFLPMLVKGPAPSSGVADVPLDAPAAPGTGEFETRELPLVTPGATPAGGALGMRGAATAPAAVQDNPDAADLAAPSSTPSAPEVAAGNYAVNFGAYASSADADAVIARLKQAQLPGFSEKTQINGRPAWRVRVGPYAEQAQAEAARLQAVKVRSDVNAQVVTLDAGANAPAPVTAPTPSTAAPKPAGSTTAAATTAPTKTESLPPEPAKPVAAVPKPAEAPKPAPAKPETPKPEPSKPEPAKPVAAAPTAPAAPAASGVGFAVQLGAFGRAEDANALRDRVRAAGFSAFVEQVRTDKGALNRVRVGPVANRGDAEQLRAQVAAKVGISGMVRPHP